MKETIEKFIHRLFGFHIYTKWYFWGETWKKRHCKHCLLPHNGIAPYQLRKGYVPRSEEE